MRLIDADELKKAIINHLGIRSEKYLLESERSIYNLIDEQPTIEQPKDVRCKDCKWSWCLNPNDESPFYVCRHPTLYNMRMSHEGNWYCGNGELKAGEQG